MSANDHLSPTQFVAYHASPTRLRKGTKLVPGSSIGKKNFSTMSNQHVYVTNEEHATHWADQLSNAGNKSVHLYEVHVPHEPKYSNSDVGLPEAKVDQAIVRRRVARQTWTPTYGVSEAWNAK